MPAPLAIDLRKRAVDAYLRGGMSYEEAAEQFGVGEATLNRWLALRRETGEVVPRPRGGGNPAKIRGEDAVRLKAVVIEKPDRTLAELVSHWKAITGVSISTSSMGKTLRRLGFSRKKSPSGRLNWIVRTSSRGAPSS